MNLLEIKNFNLTYPGKKNNAISNFNLQVKQKEFVVIMGETGAGKSSLLFSIQRLIPHFLQAKILGEIYFQNINIMNKSPRDIAGEIGLVFQDFESQLFSTSVELEVAFLPQNLNKDINEIKNGVKSCLELVGLKNFEKRNPVSLSGGEKQRLAIASILSGNPLLLLLDEPTTDLDPIGKEQIFKLAEILKSKGQTVILVEHETDNVVFADRIILMKDGEIKSEGKPKEVLKNVNLIQDCGVRPLTQSMLFKDLKIQDLPISLDEVCSLLKENYEINKESYKKLIEEENVLKQTQPVIVVKNLNFSYEANKNVLKEINIEIKKGEFVAIIGQNGSGKTTLAKHFTRLFLPDKGDVKINGMSTKNKKISEISKLVGYVFQNPDHQIFTNTVEEEVSFGPKNLGLNEDKIKQRTKEALSYVHLSGYENEDPFSLTKGERQRIAVASVLAQRPEILIFDEPTTGLDYKQILKMMDLITQLNKKGYTIIIITHSMWVVAEYASRCIVMKDGEIILDGKVREIFKEKEKLKETSLKVPFCVELSEKFGMTLLSIKEWEKVLKKKNENIFLFR